MPLRKLLPIAIPAGAIVTIGCRGSKLQEGTDARPPGDGRRRIVVGRSRLGAVALAAFVLGCGSALKQPGSDGGSGGQGGSRPDAGPDVGGDAAACDCRVENFTLTMSWACFCAKFTCTDRQPACGSNRTAYPGCGLTADNLHTVGGPWISVWDESGALVGRHYSSDTSDYQCPSDSNPHAGQVRAGRFPDATCAEVACTCTGGTTTCAAADGGADAGGGGTGGAGGTGGGWLAPVDGRLGWNRRFAGVRRARVLRRLRQQSGREPDRGDHLPVSKLDGGQHRLHAGDLRTSSGDWRRRQRHRHHRKRLGAERCPGQRLSPRCDRTRLGDRQPGPVERRGLTGRETSGLGAGHVDRPVIRTG